MLRFATGTVNLLCLALAGCTSSPPADLPAPEESTIVAMRLSVHEADRQDAPERRMVVEWKESFARGAGGGVETLTLVPQRVLQGGPQGTVFDLDRPSRMDCVRDPASPPESGLRVQMSARAGSPSATDRETWMVWLQTFLFFRELAYCLLPSEGTPVAPEWRVDLDARGFARRTRLGVWAEEELVIRGVVGFVDRASWPSADHPALHGIVEVQRAKGQILRLDVRLVFDATRKDLDSGTMIGVSESPSQQTDAPPKSLIRFEFSTPERLP